MCFQPIRVQHTGLIIEKSDGVWLEHYNRIELYLFLSSIEAEMKHEVHQRPEDGEPNEEKVTAGACTHVSQCIYYQIKSHIQPAAGHSGIHTSHRSTACHCHGCINRGFLLEGESVCACTPNAKTHHSL